MNSQQAAERAAHVRQLRAQGLTHEIIASRLGISTSTVSAILRKTMEGK